MKELLNSLSTLKERLRNANCEIANSDIPREEKIDKYREISLTFENEFDKNIRELLANSKNKLIISSIDHYKDEVVVTTNLYDFDDRIFKLDIYDGTKEEQTYVKIRELSVSELQKYMNAKVGSDSYDEDTIKTTDSKTYQTLCGYKLSLGDFYGI